MTNRSSCAQCGMLLHTGEGRVVVSFTAAELEELAMACPDPDVAARVACALGLIDADRERAVRAEREAAGLT